MASSIKIVLDNPHADGREAGHKLGPRGVEKATRDALANKHLKHSLGAMSRQGLEAYVLSRLETPPDYNTYPELQDLYPERLDYLRGFAEGAKVKLAAAAVLDYVQYRRETETWYQSYQLQRSPGNCSGIILIGPDGVLGSHSAESTPPPRPRGHRHRTPGPFKKRVAKPKLVDLTLKRPRTGYIESWGTTNEMGVGCVAGVSCGVWLDEPIEDVWPIKSVPLLRFARDIPHLEELYRRYTLHNWGRASQAWADIHGNALIVEKSFRRIGTRRHSGPGALWCTEGHFQSDEMSSFIRAKRLEYLARAGKSLGAGDMQYATDCAVRFTHIGELCDQPWGLGIDHLRRILSDHATFPRAVCRHGGPDTDPYDDTVTMAQSMANLTHNRHHGRGWKPWKRFCCEVVEGIGQYPSRPCGQGAF
ncbi:MAG: hypothetical protein NTW19_01760 [Planctomycetota bacterium]|nr:hypothetical protein [Planctomycetota bacterium]